MKEHADPVGHIVNLTKESRIVPQLFEGASPDHGGRTAEIIPFLEQVVQVLETIERLASGGIVVINRVAVFVYEAWLSKNAQQFRVLVQMIRQGLQHVKLVDIVCGQPGNVLTAAVLETVLGGNH